MEGVGSIWNANSWHWEEKNYTAKAKEYLTEHLQKISLEGFTPRASELTVSKIKEIKGSATISIRKKKQVYLYDFEIEGEWKAAEREGDQEATGEFRIQEFFQDDDPEDVQLHVTAEKSDEYHEEARRVVAAKFKPEISKILQNFHDLMKQIDADEAKVRIDAENRLKEVEEMKKAEQSKGAEKQAIFEEARRKEQEMKEREAAMKQAAKEITTDQKTAGTGSVWNPNSYFWEEKNFNKWSQEKFTELLGSFKHTVPGGRLEITNCEAKGEASISIRKGKKIFAYDFEVTLKWNVFLGEGEEDKVTGEFRMPEVSNAVYDDDEKFEVEIEYKTGQEHRDKIHDHMRGPITEAIRKNLEKYVVEFKDCGS